MSFFMDNVQIKANILARSFMAAFKLPYKKVRFTQYCHVTEESHASGYTKQSEVSYLVDDI